MSGLSLLAGGIPIENYNKKKKTNPELAKKIRNISLASLAAIPLPMLYEEAKATKKGKDILKEEGEYDKNILKICLKGMGLILDKQLRF
ncbi:MAG: hypothetical protein ACOCT9_00760 [archaeon]